jgi:hypothetical protein
VLLAPGVESSIDELLAWLLCSRVDRGVAKPQDRRGIREQVQIRLQLILAISRCSVREAQGGLLRDENESTKKKSWGKEQGGAGVLFVTLDMP